MGTSDKRLKEFVKIDTVFAQLFSKGVFAGRIRVDPKRLHELDTVNQETVRLKDGQLKDVERLRDVQKITMLFDDKMAFQVIMGVEGQEGIHYFMPVRCMEFDALTYSFQCRKISERAKEQKLLQKYADGVPKGTKIVPTVTLVFYYGEEVWDGPKSVYDMLDIPDEMKGWAKTFIPDYQMHIIDARHMKEEDIDRFDGDLKAFLLMIQENFDREKLKSVVATHRETWYAIGAVKKDKRYEEYIAEVSDKDMAGGMYMDTALDRLIAEGKAEGIIEGKAEGIIEGKTEGEARVNELGTKMKKAGRLEEFIDSLSDSALQRRLFIEFKIDKEK